MNLKTTNIHFLSKSKDLSKKAKVGVSLHCHTQHSKEMLDFIPHYADKLPIIKQFWHREQKNYLKREGKGIDFSTAYWTPPLTAENVYEIEKNQINGAGLDAIVSLTDHDSIEANERVNQLNADANAPISLEWTVPFEYGFFHVGVHNLPKESARELSQTLLDYTFSESEPNDERLTELFEMLNDLPGVLVILNHPLWDIELVGQARHEQLLKNFLRRHGRWIHAFEINGFRSWSENKAVIEMAEALGIPIATGGDRHGCKPNTVINLTNARTFEEFVEEIRIDKRSEVVLMPEYEYPLHSRQLQSFAEILTHYRDFPDGRKRWFDRIYFDVGDGHGLRPLSVHWLKGGPLWLRWAIWTLGVLGSPKMRPIFRVARKKADRVPKTIESADFEIPELEDLPQEFRSEAA
jgi:hypothetical protein